ncbi:peptide chain release factor 2 [Proteiniclasticum sp. BAD-10]|uniref:Peptide chain release factor 2 n=1 Tax=Proteiniclasticum sediminis TaxID=2804028 RepID=A0A941HPU0_9CLOT|nr:peptide chain release factor 2 [Proteiniclasticum sediminis]
MASLERKREELIYKMQAQDFWNDPQKAKEVTQEEKFIENTIAEYKSLVSRVADTQEMMDLVEEDESLEEEVLQEVRSLQKEVEAMHLRVLLSGKYDGNDVILTLKSGVGGTDAMDWTSMLLRMYTRWAEKKGYQVELMELNEGDEAGIRDASLKIAGPYAYGYLKAEKGIHRLVRISPFNSSGKRQTSFASVEVIPMLKDEEEVVIKDEDLKIDTYRSTGAGGQHVNTTDSAVRITHLPTGIVVTCQNERSQIQNRETAMKVLKAKLVEIKERLNKEKIEDITGEMKDVGWGSQIRSYVFNPYNLVKDHRTLAEDANVGSVMDGDLDLFISAYLKTFGQGAKE